MYEILKESRDEGDEIKKQQNLIPMPKGTVKVDVSDTLDWYQLGQDISDLDDADPANYGKGPPQTVIAFGSEEEEHKYLRDLNRLGMQTHDIDEDWQKTNKQDKTDGMSKKAVSAYRKENPGSKLKTAVTKKPSELKAGSKDAKRRKSFCARMSGMKKHNAGAKTKRDPDSPINKALRRWNCESIEEMQELIQLGEHYIAEKKKGKDGKACWDGYRYNGTKNGKDSCVKVKK